MDERIYWLGFSVFSGIGPHRFAKLLNFFGSAKTAWEADATNLREAELGEKLISRFIDFRSKFSLITYLKLLNKLKISFVILNDLDYPNSLKQLINPPFVLYLRGESKLLNLVPTIGIVGTRRISSYGRQVTELFTRELVDAGLIVVSGLAIGVDALAHQVALENKGKTIAVLGCGVDLCYPTANQDLYEQILLGGGLIVSEVPVSSKPTLGSFPSRNRIIAGLSQVILVTEGARDSGALITASDAFSLGKDVFAIPGQITSKLSMGPFKLLQNGAKLATTSTDVLSSYEINRSRGFAIKQRSLKVESKAGQMIIELLENENLTFDEIDRRINLDPAEIGMSLSMLELKGIVKLRLGRYQLNIS